MQPENIHDGQSMKVILFTYQLHRSVCNIPHKYVYFLFFSQNSFSSVFHMENEELGEVLDAPKR